MASNIKVAIATGDAVLKYVDTDTTVGSNGTADSNIPSTTLGNSGWFLFN
jgi:hypothetical protein